VEAVAISDFCWQKAQITSIRIIKSNLQGIRLASTNLVLALRSDSCNQQSSEEERLDQHFKSSAKSAEMSFVLWWLWKTSQGSHRKMCNECKNLGAIIGGRHLGISSFLPILNTAHRGCINRGLGSALITQNMLAGTTEAEFQRFERDDK
jgi:hypothetical protein